MEIKEVRIRWNEKYANRPEFELVVDDAWFDAYSEWEHRLIDEENQLYLAMNGDLAHFVAVANKQQRGGLGQGQCKGNLLLEGGETLRVFDGWSSRASVVNMFLPEEDHITEVVLYGGQYRMGRAGIAMKVSKLRKLTENMSGVYVVRDDTLGGEPHYCPSANEGELTKP